MVTKFADIYAWPCLNESLQMRCSVAPQIRTAPTASSLSSMIYNYSNLSLADYLVGLIWYQFGASFRCVTCGWVTSAEIDAAGGGQTGTRPTFKLCLISSPTSIMEVQLDPTKHWPPFWISSGRQNVIRHHHNLATLFMVNSVANDLVEIQKFRFLIRNRYARPVIWFTGPWAMWK